MDVFITLVEVIVSQVYKYVLTYQGVHLKYMQFIVCQLHLNKTAHKKVIGVNIQRVPIKSIKNE